MPNLGTIWYILTKNRSSEKYNILAIPNQFCPTRFVCCRSRTLCENWNRRFKILSSRIILDLGYYRIYNAKSFLLFAIYNYLYRKFSKTFSVKNYIWEDLEAWQEILSHAMFNQKRLNWFVYKFLLIPRHYSFIIYKYNYIYTFIKHDILSTLYNLSSSIITKFKLYF